MRWTCGIPGQVAVELGQGLRELLPQGINEGRDLHRLREYLIIGDPLRLLLPIGGHILARIAKRRGAFDPDLFTLQRPLQPLEDAEFIVLSVDPDRRHPATSSTVSRQLGQHHAVERHLVGQIVRLCPQGLLDHRQGLNDRLKAILAPEGQVLQHPGQHLPIVMDVLLPHDILIPDAVLGPTGLRLPPRDPETSLP